MALPKLPIPKKRRIEESKLLFSFELLDFSVEL